MQRALELAQNGVGKVSPNPLVGCVIVYENKIIGEGWHKKHGEAHAEVNACKDLKDLSDCDVYITLEPCHIFPGKNTSSCTDLMLSKNPEKIYRTYPHMLNQIIVPSDTRGPHKA